jgi:hypothetical protein
MLNGFPSASSLLVLAAYAAVFGWLAVRYFPPRFLGRTGQLASERVG